MRLVSLLFKHRHRFYEDTRYNPYGVATEQRCKCGAYRHHLVGDLHGIPPGGEPRWRDGRHPGRDINEPEW